MAEASVVRNALGEAAEHLMASRCPEGYWEGRLSSSALSTATAVSALAIAGSEPDSRLMQSGLRWLADDQNPDGGWGDTPDSPSNLPTSLLVISAMGLAGDAPAVAAARAAADQYVSAVAGPSPAELAQAVRTRYGADRTFAAPILANCALAGLVSWEDVPQLPFELAALPRGVYRLVRLQVVSYALPALIAVGMLVDHCASGRNVVKSMVRRSVRGLALHKLRKVQPGNGGFLEAPPLTAFVAMSLGRVIGPDAFVVRKCLEFLRSSAREDGSWPIDSNLSVWLTSGALHALMTARLALGKAAPAELDDVIAESAEWLAGQQQQQVNQFTGAAPGGWAWTHRPGGVPDADDTSGALLALARSRHQQGLARGVRWLLELQNADGGWPTFCRGWGRLPFDQSCPDITAHAMRALHAVQDPRSLRDRKAALQRGLRYLAQQQTVSGSWVPLWFGNQQADGGENHVLGTARVLMALAVFDPDGAAAAGGLRYLLDAQNCDGGWGGAAEISSSTEETALALAALTNWQSDARSAIDRAVDHLLQRMDDNTWTEPTPIGLYFASLWYSERLYPIIWTTEALGCALRMLRADCHL